MLKFENGIITSNDIKGIKIKTELISKDNCNARPGYQMNPEYITVHNTGDPGATAENESSYVRNQTGYKSWHFTIGNNVVIQQLPITENGWHAGDGESGLGNRNTIGIEICEVNGAEQTAISFIAELCNATKIPIEKITTHKNWDGKYCPRLILPHWDVFMQNIQRELNSVKIVSIEDAICVLKQEASLEEKTIDFLLCYKYGIDLILKLVKAIQK